MFKLTSTSWPNFFLSSELSLLEGRLKEVGSRFMAAVESFQYIRTVLDRDENIVRWLETLFWFIFFRKQQARFKKKKPGPSEGLCLLGLRALCKKGNRYQ